MNDQADNPGPRLSEWRLLMLSEHGPSPKVRLVLLTLSLSMQQESPETDLPLSNLSESVGLPEDETTELLQQAVLDGWIDIIRDETAYPDWTVFRATIPADLIN